MTLNDRQFVNVQGKKRPWTEMHGGRFYHGSPETFEPESVLEPGKAQNFKESDVQSVSVTSDAGDALHWAREAAKSRGEGFSPNVYEVEPEGDVEPWRVMPANQGKNWRLQEGRVPRAKVIRRLSEEDDDWPIKRRG